MPSALRKALIIAGGAVVLLAGVALYLGYTPGLPIDYVHISQLVPARATRFVQARGLEAMVSDVLGSKTGRRLTESAAFKDLEYSPQYFEVRSRLDAFADKGYRLTMKGLLSLVGDDVAIADVPVEGGGTGFLGVFDVSFWNRVFTRALRIARGQGEGVPQRLQSGDQTVFHAAVANFIFVSSDSSLLAESVGLATGKSAESLWADSTFAALYSKPECDGRSVLHYRRGRPATRSLWSYSARSVGVWPAGDGLAVRMEASPGPGGIVNSLVARAEPTWGYDAIPEGCVFAAVASVRPEGLWEFLSSAWLPDSDRAASLDALSAFEKAAKVDLQRGLVASLGDGAFLLLDTVYVDGPLIAPGFALGISVKDPDAAHAAISAVHSYSCRPENEVRDTSVSGAPVAFYAPRDSSSRAFTIAYTVGGDFALVSTSVQTIQKVLDARAGSRARLDRGAFGSGGGARFFADGPRLLSALRTFYEVDVVSSGEYTRRDLAESFYPFLDLCGVVKSAVGGVSMSPERVSLSASVAVSD